MPRTSRPSRTSRADRSVGRRIGGVASAAMLALTAVGVAAPAATADTSGAGTGDAAADGTAAPDRDLLLPDEGAWFGTFLRGGRLGEAEQTRSDIERLYDQRESLLGRDYDIAHHYYQFDQEWPTWREPHFGAEGTASLVSWSPVPSVQVLDGRHDRTIEERADDVRAYGDPLFVRYFWEMDGLHHGTKAGTPEQFVAAWRHIVDTFRARGADNALWVWCPTTWGFEVDRVDEWYPGDDYVDWLCADGYNFYKIQDTARDREAVDIFGDFHAWGQARGKPMMAGEYGTIEDPERPRAKGAWYDDLAANAHQLPGIRAWVYFDTIEDRFNGDNDWRPTTSWWARTAYVDMANTDWFTHASSPLDDVTAGSTAGWPTGEDRTPQPATMPATCAPAHYATSVRGGAATANGTSANPALDGDGSHVVFESYAEDLHPGDDNGASDVFVVVDGRRNLVSWDLDGGSADHNSFRPTISDDGRYVAFESRATDLVRGDNNGKRDVFVRDLDTGMTRRVSVRDGGGEGVGGAARHAEISGDGRYVVFESSAHNLVDEPTPAGWNVYRHDLETGATELVSATPAGRGGDERSHDPSISDDGRFVAFASKATDLVARDANGSGKDVFVRDMRTGVTTLVSTDRHGGGANGLSDSAQLSGDGTTVAFRSLASDLVAGDTNGRGDVFVADLASGVVTRASVKPDGGQVRASSHSPAIDDDGSVVAFHTTADIAEGGSGRKDQVHLRTDGTTVALRTTDGDPLAAKSQQAAMDDTGSHVAVRTGARNLCLGVTTDANNRADIGVVTR